MKLSITQENLSKALAGVGRIVSARSSLPILSNVLLATDSKRLKLAATNLEIGITYWVGCKIDGEGTLTVPARLFSDFVNSLPGGNIELSSEDAKLSISSPSYRSTINGIAADEFPLIPHIKASPVLSISADIFREALTMVIPAASLDEARPVLAGVYLYVEGDNLLIVATDSYRLAEKKLSLTSMKAEANMAVIVPARTISEVIRALSDMVGDVHVYATENQVMFEIGNIEITSRLIDGKFPDYKQIIPTTAESKATVATGDFMRITKVASLFARENAGSLRLLLQAEGQIQLSTGASQVGDNTSTVMCEMEGDDAEISLNAKFLAEALAIFKSNEISFSISGKLSPCVLRAAGKNGDDNYLHIIMPLRT